MLLSFKSENLYVCIVSSMGVFHVCMLPPANLGNDLGLVLFPAVPADVWRSARVHGLGRSFPL